jgi:hypothetical protein
MNDIQVGDYVRHRNGTTGEVERIEGICAYLKNDSHRYYKVERGLTRHSEQEAAHEDSR